MITKAMQYITQWMYEEGNFEPYQPPVTLMDAFTPVDLGRVWGIDISHWDGNVNLSVTKSLGASFVFIKGLDGTLQTRFFVDNRQRALDAGLFHGPYQWLYKNENVSCVRQAQAMADLLSKYPSVLPPVIDFEWTSYGGVSSNPTYTDLNLYLTELLRLGVRKPLLYTAKGYTDKYYPISAEIKAKLEGLWVANYNTTSPLLPAGWAGWDFWQFTSSGDATVYAPNDNGKLEVDLNYCISKERLEQLAGAVVIPPEPEPTGGNVTYLITNNSTTSTRTIRRGPAVIFGSVDNLAPGGQAVGDYCYRHDVTNTTTQALAGDKWLQIGENRWLAWVHKGTVYLNVEVVPDVTPPDTVASVFTSYQVTVTHADGSTQTFKADNVEMTEV